MLHLRNVATVPMATQLAREKGTLVTMASKLTIVLRVSDDTSDTFREWVASATDKVMFMGTVVDVLELKSEPMPADDVPVRVEGSSGAAMLAGEEPFPPRFLAGNRAAAEYLGTPNWTDSQGNVHWRDGRERNQP